MERLREGLLQEPGHDKVFDAMAEAINRLTIETTKTGGESREVDNLVEKIREHDKFVFRFYLKKLIHYLE